MFEYLPGNCQGQRYESENSEKENNKKDSVLIDLLIFRAVMGILTAAVLLIMHIVFPTAAENISNSFRQLSSTLSEADEKAAEAAETASEFFMRSSDESAGQNVDRI